jgi:hypothetical protein
MKDDPSLLLFFWVFVFLVLDQVNYIHYLILLSKKKKKKKNPVSFIITIIDFFFFMHVTEHLVGRSW